MHQRRSLNVISKSSYVLSEPSAGLPWVLRVATEHWNRAFVNARPGAKGCLIAYIQEGQIEVRGTARLLRAGPGNVLSLNRSDTVQEVRVSSDEGLRLILVLVRGETGCELVESCLGHETRCLPLADPGSVETLFYCMLKAASKAYPLATDITANLLRPMLDTVREEHRHATTTGNQVQELYNQCREFITHHYLEIVTVASVAERFGISHAWLCRLFRDYSDTTPHAFLLQRKMTYALHELQQHDRSVKEVATELGFADPYSFSKTFKRVMGYTPSAAKPATGS